MIEELIQYVADHAEDTVEDVADAIYTADGVITGEIVSFIRARFGPDVRTSICKLVLLIRQGMRVIEDHLDDVDTATGEIAPLNGAVEEVDTADGKKDVKFKGKVFAAENEDTSEWTDEEWGYHKLVTNAELGVYAGERAEDAKNAAIASSNNYTDGKFEDANGYTDDTVSTIKSILASFFAGNNVLWQFGQQNDLTDYRGLDFEWKEDALLHIDGTHDLPSGVTGSYLNIYYDVLPYWLSPGTSFIATMETAIGISDGVYLSIMFMGDGVSASYEITGEEVITVPMGATSVRVDAVVGSSTSDEHVHCGVRFGLFAEPHFHGDVYANGNKKLATEEYTDGEVAEALSAAEEYANGKAAGALAEAEEYADDLLEIARDDYTSIYGQRLDVTWERGNINGDGSAPVVGNSTKWMRTADFISAEYRLALAFANNPRPMLAQVFFYSSASVAGYIGKTPSQYSHFLIEPPEGTTHIKVALTTSDYDTTDGITGEMFQEYKKRIWLTYASRSLLKKVTDMINVKAEADQVQALENGVDGLFGSKTELTLESGYCSTGDGTEQVNNKRLRTDFLPYEENLVIVNKTYAGSGKYVQGFVTLYTLAENAAEAYIARTSTDSPAWLNLADNYIDLRIYAWYKPQYFRISFQWSDSSTLTADDMAGMVYLVNQSQGEIANSVRAQSGTDLLYEVKNLTLTKASPSADKQISVYTRPGVRPVRIDINASYEIAANTAVKPVGAGLYATCAAAESTATLNDPTAEGYDTDNLTTYYLKTGKEINGRLEISQTSGGAAYGWIEACHAPLPKLNPQYFQSVKSGSVVLYGERYAVGRNGLIKRQQLRLPPVTDNAICAKLLFDIPSGVTLTINELRVGYEDAAVPVETGVRLDVHGALYQYPEHTMKAFEIAGICGARSIITIPKRSSDGVWFCYHDDTFPGSKMRNDDGTTITGSEHQGHAFNTIPYTDLADYVIYGNSDYATEPICLLDDYFDFCARTGIHPVLSFHPMEAATGYSVVINGVTRSVREYARDCVEIKALAKKHGVLKWLTMKVDSGATTLWSSSPREVPIEMMYEIFGNEIEGYIVTQGQNKAQSISSIITAFNALRNAQTPLTAEAVIEMWVNKASPAEVAAITAAGYEASLVQPSASYTAIDGNARSVFHSNDYDYWTRRGVTRFVTNKTASMGLNW